MGTSFRVNVSGLKRRAGRMATADVQRAVLEIPKSKGVAALIAQALADNFDKEGPGWAPLKGSTLRRTVGKGQLKAAERQAAFDLGALRKTKTGVAINRKKLKREGMAEFHSKVEKILVRDERAIRKGGGEVGRMILQRTGLLKKVATTPGATSSNKKGIRGTNTYRVEGTTLIWGVNLIYAKAMNRGNPKRNIPARPFLVLRDEWRQRLSDYMMTTLAKIIKNGLKGE